MTMIQYKCAAVGFADRDVEIRKLSKSQFIRQSRRQSSGLKGAKRLSGGQNLKLSTKAAVFKRESLLIRGPSMLIGGPGPLLAPALYTKCDLYPNCCGTKFHSNFTVSN